MDDYFQHAPAHLKAGDAGRGKLTATKTTSTTATFDEDGDDKTNGLNIPPAAPFPDYPECKSNMQLDVCISFLSQYLFFV